MLQLPKLAKSMVNTGNVSLIGYIDTTHKCLKNNYFWSKVMCFCEYYGKDMKTDTKEPRRKTIRIPKITLIHPDKSISVTELEAAQKLAKRRRLKLIEVCENDPKCNRAIYELSTSTEYLEDKEQVGGLKIQRPHTTETKTKATKLFVIKCKIQNHDLDIKINNINTLLKKGYKVKVLLSHPDGGQESIMKKLNEGIKGITTLKKLQKTATTLTFSVPCSDSSSECSV